MPSFRSEYFGVFTAVAATLYCVYEKGLSLLCKIERYQFVCMSRNCFSAELEPIATLDILDDRTATLESVVEDILLIGSVGD